MLGPENIIRVDQSSGSIHHFTHSQWNKFLDVSGREKPDFIRATLSDIELEPRHHKKRVIMKNPPLILIYQDSHLLPLSVLRADENIILFPIDVKFALDLLVD